MPKDHQPEPRRRGDRIIIFFAAMREYAFGPKQTSASALHMSAFGGKADMTKRKCPLLQTPNHARSTMPKTLRRLCKLLDHTLVLLPGRQPRMAANLSRHWG
jgi:hypothetical protein